MNKKHTVYIQALYDLVVLKKQIDPFELLDAAKSLYTSVKATGIKNTNVRYTTPSGNEEYKKGSELSLETKAIAAFIVKIYYRWDDDNMRRLESHYDLPTTIDNILSHTKIFKTKHNALNLPCITIQDFIDSYLN